jgi:hypothetical protein
MIFAVARSGGRGVWGSPRVAGEGVAEGGYDVDAVFAGGVDVAANVEAVLGDVFAGQPAGYLLLGFGGPKVALRDIVRRPDAGVAAEPGEVVAPVAAELQQVPAGMLFDVLAQAAEAGQVGQPGGDRRLKLGDQRGSHLGWYLGEPGVAGIMPGADQPAQRVAGLDRPSQLRVGFGRILKVANEMHVIPISE